jgi:hypothetical protein
MQCPICKKTVTDPNDSLKPNAHFPFCSDRCKLIDLGRWLDGKYQIPVEPEEPADADKEKL